MRWAWDSGNKNAQVSISVCSAVSCPESVPFRAFSFPQPSTIKCNSMARMAPWQSRRPANNQRRRCAHLERGSFWERFRSAQRILASFSTAQLQVLFRGFNLKHSTSFCPLSSRGFEVSLIVLTARVKLDCSASVHSPFHSLISVFRDDGFCSYSWCFRKKIADKDEFSLETLKLQGEKISLYLSTLEYYKCQQKIFMNAVQVSLRDSTILFSTPSTQLIQPKLTLSYLSEPILIDFDYGLVVIF